jgi:hypothetical protein
MLPEDEKPESRVDITDLNRWYDESESMDKEVFAEQRSNVLLIAGEHWGRKTRAAAQRAAARDNSQTESQKLRITKNHIHKIVRSYVASILGVSPGTTVKPAEETEAQDRKAAEMNLKVWQRTKKVSRLKELTRDLAHDFVGIGELGVLVSHDPMGGDFIGYAPLVDEETGEHVMGEDGSYTPDEKKPMFSGALDFERIFAFNLLRDPGCNDVQKSKRICIRSMEDKKKLLKKYEGDPDKTRFINDSSKEDFVVFEAEKASYERKKNQVLMRRFFWRPCEEYPQGYYAYCTTTGCLEEGPLPFGIWPFVWAGFDKHPTAARARSIVKVVRPFQAELNRASSQLALSQVTLGDDKIIYQKGTNLDQGALMPGVRGITFQGLPPTVLPGRDGSQFLPYIQAVITEMYAVAMLEEELQPKDAGQVDAYAMLFRSAKTQKKFSEYAEKFEQALMDLTEISLSLQREYISDEELIIACGAQEQVNIAEYRRTTPLNYSITVEEQDETVESKLGRQLTMNHILQYVGPQLSKDELGRMIENMPFGNTKHSVSSLTLNERVAENLMLALERGDDPRVNKYDDHEFIVKRLTARMSEADFPFLPPEVQQGYETRIQQFEQIVEQKMKALQAAKDGLIPAGGAMIATDMYVPNPEGPDKPAKRVRIPYQALDWLTQRLEAQGQGIDKLEQMNQGVVAEAAAALMSKQKALPPSGGQPPMQVAPASASMGVS